MNDASDRTPKVRVTRVLPATPEEVFAAWTDPESLKQWFYPGEITVPLAEMDVRVGGRYRILMRGTEGDYDHHGEYLEVTPPRRLVFTWISPATQGTASLVTIELQPRDAGTEIALVHEQLPDKDVAERHQSGWSNVLEELAAHFSAAPN